MKSQIGLVIMVMLLGLAGCSRQAGSSGKTAADLIVAGQTTAWADGNSLVVQKREGNLVEEIHLTRTDQLGSQVIITSPRGQIVRGEDPRAVRLELEDATTQRGNNQMRAQRLTVALQQ